MNGGKGEGDVSCPPGIQHITVALLTVLMQPNAGHSMGNNWPMFRLAAAWLIVLGGSTTLVSGVAADDAQVDISIVATNCERMPTTFPFEGGDCTPAVGAVIVVTATDGLLIGTCVAQVLEPESVIASCSVTVTKGSIVTVTEDVTSLQAGFTPTEHSQVFEAPAVEPDGVSGGPVFVNLPSGEDTLTVPRPTIPPMASGIKLPAPTMIGAPGDYWTQYVGEDHFWWTVGDTNYIASPHPNYAKLPLGVWVVVELTMGTEDSWNISEFPYDGFALEDESGNVFLPNFEATTAYCQVYCSRHIENQNFTNYVGMQFNQALVFDVPPLSNESAGAPISLRTLDGKVQVLLLPP